MIIALDYDDTYTRDPELWRTFIGDAEARGHSVIIATSRFAHGMLESEDPIYEHVPHNILVVFCNHNLKREVCEKAGHKVDIWIDDQPGSIEER